MMAACVESDELVLRWLSATDGDIVLECMADWPADRYGLVTRERAEHHVANGINENAIAQQQLDERVANLRDLVGCDFHANLVIEHRQLGPIGFCYLRAWGDSLTVKVLAFTPSARGQGHFREVYWCLRFLGFEHWRFDVMRFAAFEDNETLSAYRERFPNRTTRANDSGRYPSQTGRATVVSEYTAEQHDSDPERYVGRDGSRFFVRAG